MGNRRYLTKKATQKAPARASESAPSGEVAFNVKRSLLGRVPALLSVVDWIKTTPPASPIRLMVSGYEKLS